MTGPTYTPIHVPVHIRKDDIIVSHTGEAYKVLKVNPANYRAVAKDGQTWNIRRHPSVRLATQDEKDAFNAVAPEATEVTLGVAVRFKRISRPDQKGVFIVADIKDGCLKLVALGGRMGTRYYRSIPTTSVERVDAINDAVWS